MSCPLCDKKHEYTIESALKSLAAAGKRLEQLAARMSPKQAAKRPAPGKWSVREICCHLADCEIMIGVRYRKIIAEPGDVLVAYDQNKWARRLDYRRRPLKKAVETFRVLRAGHVEILKAIPKSAWNNSGRHPEYGMLRLKDFVAHVADHDKNHVAQIERIIGK